MPEEYTDKLHSGRLAVRKSTDTTISGRFQYSRYAIKPFIAAVASLRVHTAAGIAIENDHVSQVQFDEVYGILEPTVTSNREVIPILKERFIRSLNEAHTERSQRGIVQKYFHLLDGQRRK